MEGESSHRRHIPQHKVSNKENLNILYYNARSLVPKLDELALLIETHNPDIVCIVETWLSDDILDNEISFPGFHVYRFDRNRHGGGVALYIRNHVSAKVLPIQLSNVVNHELEILTVSLYHLSFKAGLSVFYCPPNSSPYIFDTFVMLWKL